MGFTISSSGQASNTLSVPGGYTIMEDSGIVEAVQGEQGPTATVKFKVLDVNDRFSFVNQLLGLWQGSPPKGIVYSAPYGYPPSPNLICTSIQSIEGFGKPTILSGLSLPWLHKKSAIVTAVFTRPSWQAASTGGYFSISYNTSGEFLTLPETTYRFNDGTPTNTPIGIVIPEQEITVTRYRMPYIPDFSVIGLTGTLNNNPFTIGNYAYAQGTLMFNGMNTEMIPDPLGNIAYTVQYKFMFRYIDWNYYLHPSRTGGFQLVTDGNSNPPYLYGNFEAIP